MNRNKPIPLKTKGIGLIFVESGNRKREWPKGRRNKDQWNMTRVCETPVTTDNKGTRTDDKDEYECGTLPSSSVQKALFQDDSYVILSTLYILNS